MNTISYEQFLNVEILVGTVVKAEVNERAKVPALKVWVDFGVTKGILQTSSQITALYNPSSLINKQVMGCVNLGSKNIAGFESQFLLLGFQDNNKNIVLAIPENNVPNGEKLL
jgi:tRNA-binding protein